MTENALRRFFMLWATAALAAASAGVGVMLATARAEGVALAVLPVVLVAVGSLIASNRAVLVYAAFVLCLLGPLPVTDAATTPRGDPGLPGRRSRAVGGRLLGSRVAHQSGGSATFDAADAAPRVAAAAVRVTLFAAVIRGHERYGESLFSVPLRFVLYAGIAFAISDLKSRDAYRWLVVVFYAGTLWQTGVAIRGYATGTSATNQDRSLDRR